MHRREGARWAPALRVLLWLVLLLEVVDGQGLTRCWEQVVAVNGKLKLLPEKPPQEWQTLEWRVRLDTGSHQLILTVEKDKTDVFLKGPFSGRATFEQESLSLLITPVRPADSGIYRADFTNTSGHITVLCFHVSVWEPVVQPQLQANILHREQGQCNISLLCIVPSASNISYSWSCSGGAQGTLDHQSWLQLQVQEDDEPSVCCCNASNPVSWSSASADATAACRDVAAGLSSSILWLAVAGSLVLALAIFIALITCYCWRKRQKDPPGGPIEQPLTLYAEVGKARNGRDPNETSETTVGGNTIYAVICTKPQGLSYPQEPESRTIYTTIQPTRRAPSLKKKRLDPALISTAYAEPTGDSRHWCPPLQTLPPDPAGHHLS